MIFTCPECRTEHQSFDDAGACCKADHVECPLTELPSERDQVGPGCTFSYGTVFSGRWELVRNDTPVFEPTRVYPLPPLVAAMIQQLVDSRYEQGYKDAQAAVKAALGL